MTQNFKKRKNKMLHIMNCSCFLLLLILKETVQAKNPPHIYSKITFEDPRKGDIIGY